MKNQFSLEIETLCSENFNHFKPTSNGGFCAHCKKEVIDFTKMTTQEIITLFKNKETQNTCGRFNNYQLKNHKEESNQRKKNSFIKVVGLACLTLFSFSTMQGQEDKSTDNPSSKIITTQNKKDIIVKGNVSDESIPFPGVNILLEGTTIGTTTDFDGNFKFPSKLKKGDVLIFSFVGMESQKVVINNEKSASKIELKIDMKIDTVIIMGKIAVKKVYRSKKN